MKALISIIENTSTGLFHVIYYRHSPMPSEDINPAMIRLKSGGHRTEGQSLEEAKLGIPKLKKALEDNGWWVLVKDGVAFPWDGNDVPASVIFHDPKEWEKQAIAG